MKSYIVPEMEVVEFDNEDIITTSSCTGNCELVFCYSDSSSANPGGGR